MRSTEISKDLSVQELMYELKKIKRIHLGEKKTLISEVSKREQELSAVLEIAPPGVTQL